MKHSFVLALVGLVGLFAVGCAEEDASEPQSQEVADAQAPEADAEAAKVEVAAAKDNVSVGGAGTNQADLKPREPICIDLPWGTICCTPTSCVSF